MRYVNVHTYLCAASLACLVKYASVLAFMVESRMGGGESEKSKGEHGFTMPGPYVIPPFAIAL